MDEQKMRQPSAPQRILRARGPDPRLPLHEQRLQSVACSCNSEWKNIVIAFCLNTIEPRTSWQVMQEFAAVVGEGVYVPDSNNFTAVIERSMVPYGVAKPLEPSLSKRWTLSDFGSEYAAPISAYSLQWAVQHDLSIYGILGHAASPRETLAPLNRLRLLRFMYENRNVKRLTDIVTGVSIDFAVVSNHLSHLRKLGFIEFLSASPLDERWKHAWVEGKDPAAAIDDNTITPYVGTRRRIVEYIQSLPARSASAAEISGHLGIGQTTVRSVLSALKDKGYTTCAWVGREKCTDAFILDKGEEFVETWLDVVEDALSDGHVKEAMASHINDARELANRAATLYLPLSKKGRMRPFNERLTDTLHFIGNHVSKNGIGPRTMEVASGTGVMCSNILHMAHENGLIERDVTEGTKGRRWKLTSEGKKRMVAQDQAQQPSDGQNI